MDTLEEYSMGLVFSQCSQKWEKIVPPILTYDVPAFKKERKIFKNHFNEIFDKVIERQKAAVRMKIPDPKIVLIFDDPKDVSYFLTKEKKKSLKEYNVDIVIINAFQVHTKLFSQAWQLQKIIGKD